MTKPFPFLTTPAYRRLLRQSRTSSHHSHSDVAKTRRRRAVPRSHHLHRLALSAVRSSPQTPMFFVRDRIARIPEVRSDAGVRAVLEKPTHLAVLNLVTDFRAELKIQPHVVDAPGTIGLHVD